MVVNNDCYLKEDVCGLHSKYYAKHLCIFSLQRQWVTCTCKDMWETSPLADYKCSSSNTNVVKYLFLLINVLFHNNNANYQITFCIGLPQNRIVQYISEELNPTVTKDTKSTKVTVVSP